MSENKFYSHLDICTQCRNHPFELCAVGAQVLEEAVRAESNKLIKVTKGFFERPSEEESS